jgi:uncharacterized repeat protein (TIGR01451 family)
MKLGRFVKNTQWTKKIKKPLLALLLAATVTVIIGISVPLGIAKFDDSVFGKVTILYKTELVDALKAAQDKGVIMAVHGYHHEDLRLYDADTAKALVEKGVAVFKEAGLTPVAFYFPYISTRQAPAEVRAAVESVLPTSLPPLNVIDERGNGDDLLEPGEIWVYSGNYTFTQAMIDSRGNGDPIDGMVHNTVTVNCDQTQKATADAIVPIARTQAPSLDITVTASAINMSAVSPNDSIDAGDIIPYTVRVYNTGNEDLTNVLVRNSLRSQLNRNTWGGNNDDILQVGEVWTYQGDYIFTQDMIDSNGNGNPIDGKIYNTFTVYSDQVEPVSAEIAVPIKSPVLNVIVTAGTPNMAVVAPNGRIDPGDTISYTIRVYNNGNQTLTNIEVGDSLQNTLKRGTTLRESFGTEYTFGWRDMESFDDPRYSATLTQIMRDQPTSIMAHVYDWNKFTKQLIYDYLATTKNTNIQVRVDDFEPNTPVWKVTDMAELLDHSSVVRLSFGVISEGTWTGGSPTILGVGVNDIFKFYWIFFLVFAFFPFTFFLFWKLLSRKDKKPNSNGGSSGNGTEDGEKPKVSVIIPAYNEETHISSCIESVQRQDFKGNMEVIVVNDGSTDRTAEIASKYPVKLIDLKTNVGKANALNVGVQHSKGDILVFSDSDSELTGNAVNLLVNSLEEHPDAAAVAGQVHVKNVKGKNNILRYFQMIEYEIDQGLSRYLQGLNGNVLVCPGPLFAVRREIAEKTMFSNRSVIEDSDFTIELLKNRMKVYHEPEARVYTNAPVSLKGWFRQRKRWMYGNLQLWRIHNGWAKNNPWMILNYLGFITALIALILLLLLPYLFSTYDNIDLVLLRAILYTAAPIMLITLLIMPFFVKNPKLLLTIIPYILIYGTIKAVTLSYVYLRYVFRRGVSITFGPRTILAR